MDLRVAVLQAVFSEVGATRMAGLPLCHPGLQVEALGFEPLRQADAVASGLLCADDLQARGLWLPPLAIGVLVTPWCMNLVSLPIEREDTPQRVGRNHRLVLGGHVLSFIGAHEPALGSFGACSLFSPMQDFADALAARETALAVLDGLRPPAPDRGPVAAPAVPSRRGFLFGRSSANQAAA
jgi:[NiFe] hydrogenase assembly HybE family chaperone